MAEKAVQHTKSTLLECVELTHQALPELGLSKLDTSAKFFGKQLALPMMITSMSGGVEEGRQMNRALAAACEELGIAFAVGSQRIMLRHPESRDDFAVRNLIPSGVLLGNIGAQQLLEYSTQEIVRLVREIDADGLCVHLNPAHELAQAEGDRNFESITQKLFPLFAALDGNLLVKEVGCGISEKAAEALVSEGILYIDVAGAGGTSWPKVESFRATGSSGPLGTSFRVGENSDARAMAIALSEWGIPTAPAIIGARKVASSKTCIIGSGGVRSGFDVAKCLALGANMAGFAFPALKAYFAHGQAGVTGLVHRWAAELRAAMLLTGSKDIASLQKCKRIYTGELRGRLVELAASQEGVENG